MTTDLATAPQQLARIESGTPDKDRGMWRSVPMDVYHTLPGTSNSQLELVAQSPLRYRLTMDGRLKREPTHDMELGTLIHSIVNEGAEPEYYVRPDTYGPENKPWTMNATACKEWMAARRDKPVLTTGEVKMLGAVTACVKSDRRAMSLINGAVPEVMARAYNDDQDLPFLLRCRFDLIGKDAAGWYFADVKTTRDASTDAFTREMFRRKYHAQFALYRRVLRRIVGEDVRAFVIPIEKSVDVPRVNARQVTAAFLDAGDEIVDDRLRLLQRCQRANQWPALPDDEGGDAIPFIDLPEFAQEEVEITASDDTQT